MEAGIAEEDLTAFTRLLSIAVAVLESNNDNEYLLALHLLDKVERSLSITNYLQLLIKRLL